MTEEKYILYTWDGQTHEIFNIHLQSFMYMTSIGILRTQASHNHKISEDFYP